jgi:hypothetical protein
MVLELFWAATEIGASPWTTSHRIAAIVLGPGVAQSASFSIGVVATALLIHYVLGIGFGLMLGMILAEWRLDASLGTAQVTGALFGFFMYFINFYGIAYAFPWFLEMRGWATLIAHLVLGLTAAGLYWKLRREGATG